MNKRSFFLGLFSGIIIAIVIFFVLPFIMGLIKSGNNSTKKVLQTFVDAVASGDRTTTVSLLAPSGPPQPFLMSLEQQMDSWLFQQGIVSVGKHVPITLVSSTEITPAMKANGISAGELWCASFVTERGGNYQDYFVPIYVSTVNGKTYISNFINPFPNLDCRR